MSDKEMVITPAGRITIERATADDAEMLLAIHEDVARWLWDRGIHQWELGTFPRAALDKWIAHGEVYVAWLGDQPVATLTLQWSDEQTWGAMPDDAGYVHGLAVRRAYGGHGVGLALLAWAERTVAAAGKAYLRLDCMARNSALRSYYERAGFVLRDDVPHDAWSALYEKRVEQT